VAHPRPPRGCRQDLLQFLRRRLTASTAMVNLLLQPREPLAAAPSRRLALWDLGFRPFYLLAALFAALWLGVIPDYALRLLSRQASRFSP
jgi:hypothetical protein